MSWTSCSGQRRKGFTLVELLIVIGIIAVLISILLPTLQKARRMATRIHCQSTIRGIMQAVAMYQSANKGAYPYQNAYFFRDINPGVLAPTVNNTTPSWISVLVRDKFLGGGVLNDKSRTGQYYQCYEHNYRSNPNWGNPQTTSYVANGVLTSFPKLQIKGRPVLVFVMCEYDQQPNVTLRPNVRQASPSFATEAQMSPFNTGWCNWMCNSSGVMFEQLHDKGRNYGFTDGHVEWFRWDEARCGLFGLTINGQDRLEGQNVGYTDVTRLGRIIGY